MSPSKPNASPSRQHASGSRFWIAASITLLNALFSAFYSFASVIDTSLSGTGMGHQSALQLAARCIPLAFAVIMVIVVRSRIGLSTLAFTLTMVQACDAAIGTDLLRTLVSALLAALTLAAFVVLVRDPAANAQGSGDR